MKIGLHAWGSEGDIRPVIALAGGLHDVGHETVIAISSVDNKDYTDICNKLGVKYIKAVKWMDFDIKQLVRLANRNSIFIMKGLMDILFDPYIDEMHNASKHLAEECDITIGHVLSFPLKLAAHKAKKPYYSITYLSSMIPSTSYIPSPGGDLGWLLNKLAWGIINPALDWYLGQSTKKLFREYGLPPFEHILTNGWYSDTLNLLSASPLLTRVGRDWDSWHKVCGYFRIP